VFAGGDFTSIGVQPRNHIAALDATTGKATNWNPDANFPVTTLAVSGKTVYAGGKFTRLGGQGRIRIAALDSTTGLATPWDPGANNAVMTLAVSGNTIYVGGFFTITGGQSRNLIAALDATTGLATNWNPNATGPTNAGVWTLAVNGNNVYVGGEFTSIGGQNRSGIASLDATTGLATSWNPDAGGGSSGYIMGAYDFAFSGNTVYVAGNFTSIGGKNRSGIAALDATTGLATNWNPNPTSYYPFVQRLALNGNTLYVAGHFGSIGGQNRIGIAALDATTGLATSWKPDLIQHVMDIEVSENTVYFGGFRNPGWPGPPNFAAINVNSSCTTPATPTMTVGGPTTFTEGGSVRLTAPAGFSYLWSNNETTQSIDVTTSGSYTLETILDGCTSAVSAATVVTVILIPTYIFTGTGAWTDVNRWSFGMVPTNADSAIIASGAVATSSASIDVKSLTVQANASLTIQSSSGIINIKNALNNAGTITFPTTGTAGISIGGGTLNPAILSGHLIRLRSIKALSNLKVNADLEIMASFDLNGKSVDLNNIRVTLKANSSSTAQLLQPTGSALVNANNFVVERNMAPTLTAGGGAWVFVGAQTQGQNVNLWSANNPYADGTYNQATTTGTSVSTYNPSYLATGANGYKKPTGPTQTAPVGVGHRVWFRTTGFFNAPTNGVWKSTGAPKLGNHTFSLLYCAGANCAVGGSTTKNGWNLIANPYAATIDWASQTGWTKTNVFNGTYIYRHKFNNNATYINGVSVNGGSRYIPSGQGFMVWAEAANAVLQVTPTAIVGSQMPAIQREAALADVIKLNIVSTTNPDLQDQIALRWDATATAGFDQNLEANKLLSATGVNLSFLNGTDPMAILAEALPTVTTGYPLALTAPQAGTYTITFEGLSSLSNPQWSIYLLDNQTGISTLVTDAASYSFNAAQGANNGRFSLVVNPAGITSLSAAISNKVLLSPNPASSGVTLHLANAISQATTFRITNALGQVVLTATMPANATELSLDLSALANGVYMVQAAGFGVTKLVKE
jgi:hypothetical protein